MHQALCSAYPKNLRAWPSSTEVPTAQCGTSPLPPTDRGPPLDAQKASPASATGAGPTAHPQAQAQAHLREGLAPASSLLLGGLRVRLCPQDLGLKSHRQAVPTQTQPEGPGTLPLSPTLSPAPTGVSE